MGQSITMSINNNTLVILRHSAYVLDLSQSVEFAWRRIFEFASVPRRARRHLRSLKGPSGRGQWDRMRPSKTNVTLQIHFGLTLEQLPAMAKLLKELLNLLVVMLIVQVKFDVFALILDAGSSLLARLKPCFLLMVKSRPP